MARNGTTGTIRLADLKGRLVALRFTSMSQEITSKPEGPEGPEISKAYPQAQVIAFNDNGSSPEHLGTTLVFSSVLGNALVDDRDWAVGVLTETAQATDKTRSFYHLAPVEADVFDRAVKAAQL